MSKDKHANKTKLLGMSFITARYRLDRDLLFKFAVALGYKCHRCGGDLCRDTFSVDHKELWTKAEDPVQSFFDVDNIAFSHHGCNSKFTSRTKHHTEEAKLENRRRINNKSNAKRYTPEARRERYLKTGQ